MGCEGGKFQTIMLAFQVSMFVLYAVFTTYENSTHALPAFGLFQNVQVMIFVGFGFLMTFMRRYGWGATGFTMLYALVAAQFCIILSGLFHHIHDQVPLSTKIKLDVYSLMNSEFCAGAVLITFGGVIGKISPLQMLVVTLVESVFYAFNETMVYETIGAVDAGGTTAIHAFGAYFGLALSLAIGNPGSGPDTSHKNGLFAMIGTLFLWMYWPSFNAGLTTGAEQQRAIVNTVLSIGSSALAAFLASRALRGGKFEMEDVQNATLAGGVAMGASCTMRISPTGALLLGWVAGVLSTNGFRFGSDLLRSMGICDTCGIHNLHGMPAVLGGVTSALVASMANEEKYESQAGLAAVFPGMAPCSEGVEGPCGRTASGQASMQLAALACSVCCGIVGGLLTGGLVRLPWFEPLKNEACWEDSESWNIEDGDLPQLEQQQQ